MVGWLAICSEAESGTPTPQPGHNASPFKRQPTVTTTAESAATTATNVLSSAAAALPSTETVTNHLDSLYQAGAKTVQRLKPSVDQVVEEGQEGVQRGVKRATRAVREVEPKDLGLPESPVYVHAFLLAFSLTGLLILVDCSRALRSKANQAAEAAAPVLQDGLERAQHGAENVAHRGLKYWRDSGERDLREVIKNGQAVSPHFAGGLQEDEGWGS